MNFENQNRTDAFELQLEARRLQARAVANGMRSIGRWLRGAPRG